MFRSTGVFDEILCPDGRCRRPYCKFFHEPVPPPVQTLNSKPEPVPTATIVSPPQAQDFFGYTASIDDPTSLANDLYAPEEPQAYCDYIAQPMQQSDYNAEPPPYIPTPISYSTATAKEAPITQIEINQQPFGYDPQHLIKTEPNDFVMPENSVKPRDPRTSSAPIPPKVPVQQKNTVAEKKVVNGQKKPLPLPPKVIKVKKEIVEADGGIIIHDRPQRRPISDPVQKNTEEKPKITKIPHDIPEKESALEYAEELSKIDAEIQRLIQLKQQCKQKVKSSFTGSLTVPVPPSKPNVPIVPKKKPRPEVEYVPNHPVKSDIGTYYIPTPLAAIEKRKEEERLKSQEKIVKSTEGLSKGKKRKQPVDIGALFGETEPKKPKRISEQRTSSTETKPTFSKPSTSYVPPPTEKKQELTAEQIAAAKQRVARPGAIRPLPPSQAIRRVQTATEQLQKRMQAMNKPSTSSAAPPAVKKPKTLEEQFGGSQRSKGESRTARAATSTSLKPALLEPTNPKVPMNVRLPYLDRIFRQLLEFLPPNEAAVQAQEEEKAVFDKVTHKQSYMVAVVNTLKRLRDAASNKPSSKPSKGISHSKVLAGPMGDQITVGAGGPKVKIPLTEERLYDALSQHYLLNEDQLKDNSYPLFVAEGRVYITPSPYDKKKCKRPFVPDYNLDRVCVRCSTEYTLNVKGLVQPAQCVYHLKSKARLPGKIRNNEARHPCCGGDDSVPGCKLASAHVSDTLKDSELNKFVWAPRPDGPNDPRSKKVYALDCEMIYTVWGPALARVTIVDFKEDVVLDEIIKPPHTVIDYNTQFSGITANEIETASYTLETIRPRLFELINRETILIGHSLESDLKAMRLVHVRVVDTAILFPHRIDNSKKRGLKELCMDVLNKSIQEGVDGHDSKEDSIAALELVIHKCRFDQRV